MTSIIIRTVYLDCIVKNLNIYIRFKNAYVLIKSIVLKYVRILILKPDNSSLVTIISSNVTSISTRQNVSYIDRKQFIVLN